MHTQDFLILNRMSSYGGFTLTEHQVPTKTALSLPSSGGQWRETVPKIPWLEIRAERDHSPVTATGKTDATGGN